MSGLRCRPGDLAVVVRAILPSDAQYLGRVIRCVSLAETLSGVPAWETEPVFVEGMAARDDCLRPLRDSDGADETLSWKTKEAA